MKTLYISLKITIAFCVILFVGYVGVLCGFAQLVKPNHGQAEVVKIGEKIVGADNVGQQFTDMKYFWGRPSAVEYDGGGSGGSNKGPTNPEYLEEVRSRIDVFLQSHPYLERKDLPAELVTASGSGLDPHISPEAATVQVRRVAQARGMSEKRINDIITATTERPFIGQPFINVLKLNVALDNEKNN